MRKPISTATVKRTAEQLAMFMAARDAHENGKWPDGLTHPTWEELGEPGQEAYRKDATTVVAAMVRLGWLPGDAEAASAS